MVCIVCGEIGKSFVKGVKLVWVKMDVIVESIRVEVLREKWVKEVIVEVNLREEWLLNKKRKIFE